MAGARMDWPGAEEGRDSAFRPRCCSIPGTKFHPFVRGAFTGFAWGLPAVVAGRWLQGMVIKRA